jgi:hypothetical protein|tara:strand:- start:619 stop:828 length:210 start_codon:yes stop_codon:yes gene_type:complete
MRRCAYINMDEYPCQDEGIEDVGTKCYCEGHAEDVRAEDSPDPMFEDELVGIDTYLPNRYSDDYDPLER